MKKWLSILLLSLYLVSTTELNQLLKFPTLVEHYSEHKKLNPEMSLLAFFKIHYDHPVKDADYKTDRKLPFILHSTLSLVFTLNSDFSFEILGSDYKYFKVHNIPAFDVDFYIKGYLHSIWQPPRA
ncbi:hypothetical protein MQX03_03830 [Chryseobacterium aahli]|uniref:hypothetical protein n=1 Tax=Chryseobacterium aahli TaxID=1278643 RepID=UPI001F60A684|nr:hypothetical protein [Chryseobacterium aahli]MCI3936313.1 hypothetical protein [Chryseobacterium aahli]